MISLSDSQIGMLMQFASVVPVERRSMFLERVGAMLKLRYRYTDQDVSEVAALALAGLVQEPALEFSSK
jgi:hypothetical protein